jgi:hypothetical protein
VGQGGVAEGQAPTVALSVTLRIAACADELSIRTPTIKGKIHLPIRNSLFKE